MPVKRYKYNNILIVQKKVEIGENGELILPKDKEKIYKRILESYKQHSDSLKKLINIVEKLKINYRLCFLSEKINTEEFDLILTIGGDGTVLHASHYIGRKPILPINSAPDYSVGYLTSTDIYGAEQKIILALKGILKKTKLYRMAVWIDGEKVYNRVLNDILFSHECPASTSRYILQVRGKEEYQMSSGIWIGPASGSTAAIKAAGGKILPPQSKKIQFIVREPYRIKRVIEYKITKGIINGDKEKITIINQMDKGSIYIDGPQLVLPVYFGQKIEFTLGDEPLIILGFNKRKWKRYI